MTIKLLYSYFNLRCRIKASGLKDKTEGEYELTMPRPYSEDLRWRAIWMKEMLGFQVDEVAAALWMSPRTIERYVSKVLNSGDVKAGIIGRPANSVAMHQHVEFLIMEAVLEHPEKL